MGVVLSLLGIEGDGYIGLLIICTIWGTAGAFISLAISRWMAKRFYRIQVIKPDSGDIYEQKIYRMVEKLANQVNIPVPEVGIYDSPEPNAFATGPSKKSSIIAFSTGIINLVNQNELEAVAGHEMSHIKNGDMVTLTFLTGIANAFVMFLSRVIASIINSALRGDDDEGGLGYFTYFIVVSLLETVFMVLAYIPISAFSRWREYKADEGSAYLTSPNRMADALAALGTYDGTREKKNAYAMYKIESRSRVSIFSTHPSLESRIKRLREMSVKIINRL